MCSRVDPEVECSPEGILAMGDHLRGRRREARSLLLFGVSVWAVGVYYVSSEVRLLHLVLPPAPVYSPSGLFQRQAVFLVALLVAAIIVHVLAGAADRSARFEQLLRISWWVVGSLAALPLWYLYWQLCVGATYL